MIFPGSMLGMLGGGQLGKMFTAAAQQMGYRVLVVDPDPHAPAAQIADKHLQLAWDDPALVGEVADHCAAVTTEFENVPAAVLQALASRIPTRPAGEAVRHTQDRIAEKRFLNSAHVPTAAWTEVDADTDLAAAWAAIGAEAGILKTARLGYDGKGQAVVTSLAELTSARAALKVRCILERRVALEREVSVMVARNAAGQVTTWPVAENVHVNGILHTTVVPADIPAPLADEARMTADRLVTALDYVGVMGVECFVADGGQLMVNELAPRPHNSGHWTIDASVTSQFEQQVRVLANLPLGDTSAMSPVAMINLLGDLWPTAGSPPWERALAIPGVRLHLYGKADARPGRKMGHLTVTAPDSATALQRATSAWEALRR